MTATVNYLPDKYISVAVYFGTRDRARKILKKLESIFFMLGTDTALWEAPIQEMNLSETLE